MLDSVAITQRPAGVGRIPLSWLPGDIRHASDRSHWPVGGLRLDATIRRAIDSVRARRPGAPLVIAEPDRPTVERVGPLVVLDGEPCANRTMTFTPALRSEPEAVPVRVARIDNTDHFVIDTPPRGRNPRRRTKLLWQDQPVGHHVGEVGRAGLAFSPTRTIAGREALALAVDGVVDGAVVRRLADASWSAMALVVL